MPDIVEINGTRVAIPDHLSDTEKSDMVRRMQGAASTVPTSAPTSSTPVSEVSPTHPDNHQYDPDYVQSAKILYKGNKGVDFPGSNKEAADWATDHMRWINSNPTFGMTIDATRLTSASPDYKKAFLYALDKYDNHTDTTAKGVAYSLLYSAADPTNLIGLTSLGLGFGAKAAGQLAGKEALKTALKASIANAAIEGALYTGASDALKQQAQVNAGGRDGIAWSEVAGSAALGGAVGAPLGAAGHYVGQALRGGSRLAQDAPGAASEDLARVSPETPTVAAGEAPVGPEITIKPDGTAEARLPELRTDEPIPSQALAPTEVEPIAALKAEPSEVIRSTLSETPTSDLPRVIAAMKAQPEAYGDWKNVTQEFAQATHQLDLEHAKLQDLANRGDADALDKIEELNLRRDILKPEDTSLSSTSGDILSNRANNGYFNTNENRGLSPSEILKRDGIDPKLATAEQKLAANNEYIDTYNKAMAQQEASQKMRDLDDAIDKAWANGDSGTALNLIAEKEGYRAVAGADLPQDSKAKKFMNGATEWMISSMFGPGTVFANTVSSGANMVAQPLGRWFTSNPLSKVELNRVMSTYGAMITQQNAALKLAMLAFKYEESMTTKDYTRNVYYSHAIPGKLGGAIRFFPRLLNASDEYLARLTYSGYVQGTAAAQATMKGQELGLTGSTLDKFVKTEVKRAMDDAWFNPGNEDVVTRLRHIGIRKGYSGNELNTFIKVEMNKNGDLLNEAANKSGESYTKDILFKREFSGEGILSYAAQNFENALNKQPALRIIQPFFRTIVRVFEEGARLTPGLNTAILFNDLRGVNGEARRARAYGEVFLSQAIAVKFLMDYSANQITGSGPDKPAERKQQEDAGFKPYAIYGQDGGAFQFRNLDPFATPLKIMANGMDRLRQLQLRQAQGEYVGQDEKLVFDSVKAAFITLVSTVKDANLTSGINDIITMGNLLGTEQSNENAIGKFAARKVGQFVPGLITKYENLGDPTMLDPANFSQTLAAKFNKDGPKSYNALGEARVNNDPIGSITGLLYTSKDDRTHDDPVKAAVLGELARIGRETGASFEAPYKHKDWPGLDLREQKTADGKETLYDRWNKFYSETPVTQMLHSKLVGNTRWSTGTASVNGTKVEAARDIINGYREKAMERLIKTEAEGHMALRKQELHKRDVLKGRHDVPTSLWSQ